MKYRAILNDPGNLTAERPVQILSNSLDDVKCSLQKPGMQARIRSPDAGENEIPSHCRQAGSGGEREVERGHCMGLSGHRRTMAEC